MEPMFTTHFLIGKDGSGNAVIIAFSLAAGSVEVYIQPYVLRGVNATNCHFTHQMKDKMGCDLWKTNNMSRGLARECWDILVGMGFEVYKGAELIKFNIIPQHRNKGMIDMEKGSWWSKRTYDISDSQEYHFLNDTLDRVQHKVLS